MFKTLKYMLRFQKCQRETQKLCEATPTKFARKSWGEVRGQNLRDQGQTRVRVRVHTLAETSVYCKTKIPTCLLKLLQGLCLMSGL